MKNIRHEALKVEFVLKDDLRQRDVEAFFKARRKLYSGGSNLSGPEENGTNVRAATMCEWLGMVRWVELEAEEVVTALSKDSPVMVTTTDVDDMQPSVVTWLSAEISEVMVEAYEVPGE